MALRKSQQPRSSRSVNNRLVIAIGRLHEEVSEDSKPEAMHRAVSRVVAIAKTQASSQGSSAANRLPPRAPTEPAKANPLTSASRHAVEKPRTGLADPNVVRDPIDRNEKNVRNAVTNQTNPIDRRKPTDQRKPIDRSALRNPITPSADQPATAPGIPESVNAGRVQSVEKKRQNHR